MARRKLVKIMAVAIAAATVATSMPVQAAFDADYYAKKYPEVVAAVGSSKAALEKHYNEHGAAEGRIASQQDEYIFALAGMFDAAYYAKQNPDVVKVYGNDTLKLFAHFLRSGMKEGRNISPYFNINAYKKAYPDLVKAFGDNFAAYYMHFATYGQTEHRVLGGFPSEKVLPGGVPAAAVSSSSSSDDSSGGSSGGSTSGTPVSTEPTIEPTNLTTEVGNTHPIRISNYPSTVTFAFSDYDESIVTVDENGVITAVAPGTTTIKVTPTDTAEEDPQSFSEVIIAVRVISADDAEDLYKINSATISAVNTDTDKTSDQVKALIQTAFEGIDGYSELHGTWTVESISGFTAGTPGTQSVTATISKGSNPSTTKTVSVIVEKSAAYTLNEEKMAIEGAITSSLNVDNSANEDAVIAAIKAAIGSTLLDGWNDGDLGNYTAGGAEITEPATHENVTMTFTKSDATATVTVTVIEAVAGE